MLQTIGAEKEGRALNSRVTKIKSLTEASASDSTQQRHCTLFYYKRGKPKDPRKNNWKMDWMMSFVTKHYLTLNISTGFYFC